MGRLKKYIVGSVFLSGFLYSGFPDFISDIPESNALNPNDSVAFIAHRGISNYYPENSLKSVESSANYNFNGVEVDISRSADSLVVFHDEDGKRLLGIDKKVSELKTSELKKYPIIYHEIKAGAIL